MLLKGSCKRLLEGLCTRPMEVLSKWPLQKASEKGPLQRASANLLTRPLKGPLQKGLCETPVKASEGPLMRVRTTLRRCASQAATRVATVA